MPVPRINRSTPAASRRQQSLAVNHIAIIPDGNRRWAAAQGIPLWNGIRVGVKTAETIFEAIRRRQIPWCTFWASSYDNLTERSPVERAVLNELFAEWFSQLATNETVHREQIRIRVLGEWRVLLEAPAVRAIENLLAQVKDYTGSALTFLIGYDGDRELVAVVNTAAKAVGNRQQAVGTINDLRAHAWTHELPPVDLLIRTGAWTDPHRSANFLPLLTSNVQEAYPPVFWPAFSETNLDAVIADFAQRERRLGR